MLRVTSKPAPRATAPHTRHRKSESNDHSSALCYFHRGKSPGENLSLRVACRVILTASTPRHFRDNNETGGCRARHLAAGKARYKGVKANYHRGANWEWRVYQAVCGIYRGRVAVPGSLRPIEGWGFFSGLLNYPG